jgi:hypothetical protein
MKKITLENFIIYLLLAAGVALALWQFVYNRSLWLDESMLALNIIHKNYFELTQTLDYHQAAPILFLQIEKFFSLIISNSEYALRIFPLLSFFCALFLFYKIIIKFFNDKYSIIFALSLFVFNGMLIRYSSEVKQYMTDVCALLMLFLFSLKDYKREKSKFWLLGIFGCIAIFLSNVAPIILLTCGMYLLYEEFFVTKRKRVLPYLFVFGAWVAVFIWYYLLFIYNHPSEDFMVNWWRDEGYAFLPINSVIALYRFAAHNTLLFSTDKFIARIWIVLFIIGFAYLIKKKRIGILILTIFPLITHLILSAIEMYPVSARTCLYFIPSFIFVSAFGFEWLFQIIFRNKIMSQLKFLVFVIPILYALNILTKMPIEQTATKKSIQFISENIQKDEKIYVYFQAIMEFTYYKDIDFIDFKNEIISGEYAENREAKENFFDEMNKLTGKNWLLFSAFDSNFEYFIPNSLDSIGYKKLNEFHTTHSVVYLYDFGKDN